MIHEALVTSVNKRRTPRKLTTYDGIVVAGSGQCLLDCTIANITTTGAGIKLAESKAVPDTVHLIVMAEKRAYAAIVVWRKPESVGLKFVSAIELGGLPTRDTEFLNRIWASNQSRFAARRR